MHQIKRTISCRSLYVKVTLIVVCVCLALNPVGILGQPLTLEQVVELGRQNNELIQQYHERVTQSQYRNREARGNFLPSVSLQANYTHLKDPLQIDLDPIRQALIQMESGNQVEFTNLAGLLNGVDPLSAEQRAELYAQYYGGLDAAVPPFVETFKEQNYSTAAVVGLQPLFLGGKLIAAQKAAAAGHRAAEAEFIKVQNEVIGETIIDYLTVIIMTEIVNTRQDVLAGMERHRSDANRLFAEGLIARSDLLRAEVAVADAERDFFDDHNRLELALVALRHTIGMPQDAALAIVDSLVYAPITDTLAIFQQAAESGQPLLAMLAEKKKIAGQKYAIERSEFLPQVAAFGRYELLPDDLSSLEPRWAIGVQLNLNIFSGMQRRNRLQSARHLKDEVAHLDAHTRRQIDLAVQKLYRMVRNAEERYVRLAAGEALARENLRINGRRFQTGLGNSLEVIDAQLSLQKNRIERLRSLYDYYVSLTKLYVTTGQPLQLVSLWESREK